MNKFVLLLVIVFLCSSCQKTKRVFIGSHQADCVGVVPQKCLLYKENASDQWSNFYDTITGFEYEAGYLYEIEVIITKIENPPADGSSLRYTLVKIISKEKDQSVAQHTSKKTQNHKDDIISIEYEALSRGSFLQIKINKDLIKTSSDRNLEKINTKKCAEKDWNTILSVLKNIDIDKISELEAPTGKRLFDGAPHAQLKITSKIKSITSSGFDHGSPPKELQQLVSTMLSLSEHTE
ncbi:DUF4377 domain-containing protein [Aquimarina longa]|uniref:DUF4377 domain-containing protein n=1 Tax=Aquimarina longa TaxID=1080221 RepID=UPI000783835A|nr:DUF4377 domain-containing protein [Aquimarina longa]